MEEIKSADGINPAPGEVVKASGKERLELFIGYVGAGMGRGEAAMKAGYGNTKASAQVRASILMKRPEVRERIAEVAASLVVPSRKQVDELPEKDKRKYLKGHKGRVKKLASAVARGDELMEASKNAGFICRNDVSHKTNANHMLAKPKHIRMIKEVLDGYGLTDDCGARVLLEGLSAMKPVVVPGGKDNPAMVEQHPDHFVRKQFLDVMLKLRGHYRDTGTNDQTIVNIINHVKMRKEEPLLTANVIDVKPEGSNA